MPCPSRSTGSCSPSSTAARPPSSASTGRDRGPAGPAPTGCRRRSPAAAAVHRAGLDRGGEQLDAGPPARRRARRRRRGRAGRRPWSSGSPDTLVHTLPRRPGPELAALLAEAAALAGAQALDRPAHDQAWHRYRPGPRGRRGRRDRPARPVRRARVAGQAAVLVDVGEPAAAVQLLEQARRRPDGPAQARLGGAGHGRGGRGRAARRAAGASPRPSGRLRRRARIGSTASDRPAGRAHRPAPLARAGLVALGDRGAPSRCAARWTPGRARPATGPPCTPTWPSPWRPTIRQEAAAHARTARELATGIGSDAHRGPPGPLGEPAVSSRVPHPAVGAGPAVPAEPSAAGQLVGRAVRVHLARQHPLGQRGQAAAAADVTDAAPRTCSRAIASISAPARASRRRSRSPDASSHVRCASRAATSSSTPSPRAATVRTTGCRQPASPGRPGLAGPARSCAAGRAPSGRRRRGRPCSPRTRRRSRGCRPSPPGCRRPCPGASSTTVVSASATISTSDCPTPDRLDQHHVAAGRVEHPQRLRRGPGQAAEVAAGGHRADEHAVVGGVLAHPDPVAEQRAAGERRRRVDRQHARPAGPARAAPGPAPTWRSTCRRRAARSARRRARARCAAPARAATSRSSVAARVLDQRDQPGDGARLTAPRPLDQVGDVGRRAPPDAGSAGGRHAHDQRVALAAAAAQRGRARRRRRAA